MYAIRSYYAMNRAIIKDQENSPLGVGNKPFQKLNKNRGVHALFGSHESHLSARADSRYQVHFVPGACGLNDRCLPLGSPSCTGMVVRANSRFITEENLSLLLLRKCFDFLV